MNPFAFARRRPFTSLMLFVALVGGGVFGMYKMRVDIPALKTPVIYARLDHFGVRAKQMGGRVEAYFHKPEEEHHLEQRKVVVTSPEAKAVTLTQGYVCQIHSQRHINVCALDSGYLEDVLVKEGQTVKADDLMFKIKPVLYKAKADAEIAEAQRVRLELNNTKRLFEKKNVSKNEVQLYEAKLMHAQAKADLAKAELNFTDVRAPFAGIVDLLHEREGSLIKEGELLTTLSDNRVMWVYFNVPEAQYLEYMAGLKLQKEDRQIQLVLADGTTFNQVGRIGAIEANFDNTTGNIPFRADFPQPGGPAAPRPDRQHPDQSGVEGRRRHPAAGDLRDPRQEVRVRPRQG